MTRMRGGTPAFPGIQSKKFWSDIQTFTVDDGLPANTITALLFDDDGYLWIGTSNGVSRFNGHEFEKRPYPVDEETRAREYPAYGLCKLPDGTIISTTRYTAYHVDPVSGQFDRLDYPVYAHSYRRPCYLKWHNKLYTTDEIERRVIGFEPGDLESDFEIIGNTTDILAVPGYFVMAGDGRIRTVSESGAEREFLLQIDSEAFLRLAASHREGHVWVYSTTGTVSSKLILFDLEQGVVRSTVLPEVFIRDMIEDNFGRLWILSGTHGLFVLDTETWELSLFDGIPVIPLLTAELRNDKLWIGTNAMGLISIDTRPNRFGLIPAGTGFGPVKIGSISKNLYRFGRYLWVVHYVNPSEVQQIDLITGEGRVWKFEDVLEPSHYPLDLYTRDGQNFWLGLRHHAVLYFNSITGARRLYELPEEHSYTGILFEDDTYVWAASSRHVIRLTKKDGTRVDVRLVDEQDFDRYLALWQLKGVPDEARNRIWFMVDSDLAWIDRATLETRRIPLPEATHNILKDLLLEEDIMWVASESGLFRYHIPTGEYEFLDDRSGLPDHFIYGILPDQSGGYWVSSNRGLSRFERDEKGQYNFSNYSIRDGLQSNEFNTYMFFSDEEGIMWFGGVGGINYFIPESIVRDPEGPALIFESFRLFGREVPLDTVIQRKRHIHLDYSDYDFTIGFTGLVPRRNDEVRYSWQMVGQDPDWIDGGYDRTVRYTNLKPGTYRFRVRAANYDNVWGEPAELIITISGPFWQSAWFMALMILGFAGITAGSIRYVSVRKYKKRLMELEKQNLIREERTRIARDLHDEIGARLTHIARLSDTMNTTIGTSGSGDVRVSAETLRKVSDSARENIRNLSEIVWSLNPRNDGLESTIVYLQNYAEQLFDESSIRILFDVPERLPEHNFPANLRHNLLMCVKEALHNCLKHSQATEILFTVGTTENTLILRIRDNGVGLKPGNLSVMTGALSPAEEKTGTGVSGNDHENNTTPTGSNGYGLLHLRERLKGFGGHTEIISEPGSGCEVIFYLPLKMY